MGGGRTALFPGTKGADPQQITLFPDTISVRHRGPTYVADCGDGGGVTDSNISSGIYAKDRMLLPTPPDVLKMYLLWRIDAISGQRLLMWMQEKLNNKQYHMEPAELRRVLSGFVVELRTAKALGSICNRDELLPIIESWEKVLESL